MRIRVTPGSSLSGQATVPGDKSIAHRWLIFAATATGTSRLVGLPASLDVRSTASCLAAVAPKAGPALELWARKGGSPVEDGGSTWNAVAEERVGVTVEVEGEGRQGWVQPSDDLDCGNSGTSMRLLAGVLASVPLRSVLVGDVSLSTRPMERVADPLRRMGAVVVTADGHPPIVVEGGHLVGIHHPITTPSAQVKGAVLLAGLAATGETTVTEPVATRDHTERLIGALGLPIRIHAGAVTVDAGEHEAFAGEIPGDVSSAAFLIAAAALTGSALTVVDVGLNPTRLHFLEVMGRMGIVTQARVDRQEMGEPVGALHVDADAEIRPVDVREDELPLVIDEVPILALLAAHANGTSRFEGADELRLKESDRVGSTVEGVRGLGGDAAAERSDLVIAGGGLVGGSASAAGDHRIAMALAVGALAAGAPCEIDGMEAAMVSFPGFVALLGRLGARLEIL